MRHLLDTNIIIYFLDGSLPPAGFAQVLGYLQNREASISLISKIEVLGFQFHNLAEEEKANRLVANLTVLPISDAVAKQAIEVRKSRKIKIADAIIAATAAFHGIPVCTRNVQDFQNLAGVSVVNPFSI